MRQFPLNRIVLLYAITCFLRNKDKITDSEFIHRLRSINNLIQNSEDEVSDRIDRNRLPAILEQTDVIMLKGEIDDGIENSFNVNQIAEEKEKKTFLEKQPEQASFQSRISRTNIKQGSTIYYPKNTTIRLSVISVCRLKE